ncbi:hypothetical protein K438DRAFT_218161 [Mycena galopus ATCC 62051]|nr:hypothetical protein K438DRAFT_218161 [Mycena galopus ATCC 62051]
MHPYILLSSLTFIFNFLPASPQAPTFVGPSTGDWSGINFASPVLGQLAHLERRFQGFSGMLKSKISLKTCNMPETRHPTPDDSKPHVSKKERRFRFARNCRRTSKPSEIFHENHRSRPLACQTPENLESRNR